MTHINNIPHILNNGIAHSGSERANPNYVPIGDASLISSRNNFILKNGRRLGDYIPFYFGVRTPMLYVIQNGFNLVTPLAAEEVVYCVTSVQKILDLQLEFVFTDGHAVDGFSSQYTNADIVNINNLIDRKAIEAKYWKDENDLDRKRRKEAEFLVLGDIPKTAILGYITFNESAKSKLVSYGVNESIILIKSEYYF